MSRYNASYKTLCDYMFYAFRPDLEKARAKAMFYAWILTDPDIPTFVADEPGSCRELAVDIFRGRMAQTGRDKIRMGVTAGLDSRGLLGVALEVLPPEAIIAYTSGQAGNPDFEHARSFTQHVLPTHFLITTQGGDYHADEWVARFRQRPSTTAGTLYGISNAVNSPMKPYSKEPSLSGFLGDATSGKRLKGHWSETWDEALSVFLSRNEVFRPGSKRMAARMVPPEYDPLGVMPAAPLLPREVMGYDDQLDMCFRQHQRIGINFIGDGGEGLEQSTRGNIITVYNDARWQKSYLTMPHEQRLGQKHYRWMLHQNWPEIFSDLAPGATQPTAKVIPDDPRERLELSARTSLHTNWELLWSRNEQFNGFARNLLTSLSERGVLYWLDIPALIAELDRDVLGLGKMIWCLCSVELNLRSGNLPLPEVS